MSCGFAGFSEPSKLVNQAEQEWLSAVIAEGQDGLRRLMHPECVIVHGPSGHISAPEDFLRYAAGVGRISAVTVHDVTIQHFDGFAIASCLQESRIAFVPEVTPFVIQAAVSRVWAGTPEGLKLVHMQMARRQLPG